MKFWWELLSFCRCWKTQFFWVGHFDFFFIKKFFFCLIPMKTRQSLLVSKDGSKFWWLPWFPAQNHQDKIFLSWVYQENMLLSGNFRGAFLRQHLLWPEYVIHSHEVEVEKVRFWQSHYSVKEENEIDPLLSYNVIVSDEEKRVPTKERHRKRWPKRRIRDGTLDQCFLGKPKSLISTFLTFKPDFNHYRGSWKLLMKVCECMQVSKIKGLVT